ncbi:MAG: alpha-hydroxy-acid oxidizing protein [Rhodobacterales bacterium]|nr:alpha-hydroxy-acid oxidizing protein [Rhodobacterales bacterium]MDX5500475.1 alpha-hydroxy-acid oxidizing protein [Rhodobacterales bacterium]
MRIAPAAISLPRRRHVSTGPVARAQSIEDLRAMALRRLPRFSAEYLEGGAEDERALTGNRAAFDDFRMAPRILRDISSVDLSTTLLGKPMALPFGIGPTGFNGLLWPDGDRALAAAAGAAGIPFGQSTVSNASIAHVASVPGLRHWFQLYCYGPDTVWQSLLDSAQAAGCEALVVTVDTPVIGNREWDRRNYAAPGAPSLSAKLDMLRHPGWLWRTIVQPGMPRFPNLEPFAPEGQRDLFGVAAWTGANMRLEMDWAMLARIRAYWPGKLIIKGVQHIDDLRLAIEAGADGVVLSNHGGRQVDRAIAPLHLIAPARAATGPDFTILADSGFRRGADVVMALALGANAVLMGRTTAWGLAAGGQPGVARAIAILTEEIRRTMQLLGVTRVADLSPEIFA